MLFFIYSLFLKYFMEYEFCSKKLIIKKIEYIENYLM